MLPESTVITLIVGLVVVVVTALLRDNFGETEADRLVKLHQNVLSRALVITKAAESAILMVEAEYKKAGSEKTPEELRNHAVAYAAELLKSWGVYVNTDLVRSLATEIEAAYQRFKRGLRDSLPTDSSGPYTDITILPAGKL